MTEVMVSPSILSADLLSLGAEIRSVEEAGADLHHVDVMDGHFVPNLSFGLPLIKQLKKIAKIPLDVHIMVSNPDEVAIEYVKAGADILTFHIEAANDPIAICRQIKEMGKKVGIAMSPDTSLDTIHSSVDELDLILIMSVYPGFSGQKFISSSFDKLKKLKHLLVSRGNTKTLLSVDGGVGDENASKLYKAGANVLVAGSYVYSHADRRKRIQRLKQFCT